MKSINQQIARSRINCIYNMVKLTKVISMTHAQLGLETKTQGKIEEI